jgi:hypothetical protein
LIYLLLSLCGSLLFSLSTASAQACTAVIYVFRHAEDQKEPVKNPYPCLPGSSVQCSTILTPVGMKHADLYRDEMIPNFTTAQDYCPVGFVFSVNPILPNGHDGGTTNPYFTGNPLAENVTGDPPIVTIGDDIIDEYLTVVTPEELHEVLLGITKSGSSAALFWTSQGLHDLGKALGSDVIPVKNNALGVPPRNAAYIFKYNGGDEFVPPAKATEYVQCFNVKVSNGGNIQFYPNDSTPQLRYYCGRPLEHGSLDAKITESQFPLLHAKICATDGLTPTGTGGYFGYCIDTP